MLRRMLGIAALAASMLHPQEADASDLCLDAARLVSGEAGVPYKVLAAIALTESGRRQGRRFAPWPWTINAAGTGAFLESRADAVQAARRHFSNGTKSVDIGCFQVNHRWHGAAFASLEAMFDPVTNARYAARFLSRLYGEYGDWTRAAGAYHSRTERHASRYRALFAANLKRVDPEAIPAAPSYAARSPETRRTHTAAAAPDPGPRTQFPLLVAGRSAIPGSLVPEAGTGSPLFETARGALFSLE